MKKLILRLLATVFIAILIVPFANISPKAIADNVSPWLDISSSLIMQKEAELSSGTTPPSTIAGYGNIDCLEHTFVTRPAQILPIPQTGVSHVSCGVQAPYGIADYSGYLELNNTSVAGSFVNPNYSGSIIVIPNSTSILNYQSAALWGNLYLTKNVSSSINFSLGLNGERTYKVNRPADVKLKDKAGHSLLVSLNTMSFSANGKWMVVDLPNSKTVRVNLETFEVLAFANSPNYNMGLDPAMKTAISSDGRYVTLSSFGNNFSLYDLSTCTDVPDIVYGSVNCQSRSLASFVSEQIPGFRGMYEIRFIGEYTLSFYANYYTIPNNSSTNKVAKFLLSAPGHTPQKLDYLAMGDSYISGEGAYNYLNGTDTTNNRCHLSLVSYPYLLSRELNFDSFHSVACSGATMSDITNTDDNYLGQADNKKISREQRSPQDIDSIFASFSPGYINQSDFVSRYHPKIITISIAGNDIGFSNILERCMESNTCYSTYEDRLELVRQINGIFSSLVDTYTKIKNAAAPDSKIYTVGYPQIAKPGGNCAVNVQLNADEIEFSRLIIDYLDTVIKTASDKAGVFYVDTQNAFDGHKLCETKSSDVAVNGLTAGNSYPDKFGGPIGSETYHPNQLGHKLLEKLVLSASQNLTISMPLPNLSATPPLESNLEILNAPHSGRVVNIIQYDNDLAGNVAVKNIPTPISVDGLDYSLKPNTSYRVEVHSDPIVLGSYTTDASGNLTNQIQLPSSMTPGIHTLHVYGVNFAGESIDIYKTIYVASSEGDWDGDGVPNSSQACLVGDASGQDYDQDGIDDACDGFIDEAPTPPPAPVIPDPEPQQPAPNPEPSTSPSDQPPANIQPTENPQDPNQTDSSSTTIDVQTTDSSNVNFPDKPLLVLTSSQNPSPQLTNSSVNRFAEIAHFTGSDTPQPTDNRATSPQVLATNTETTPVSVQKTGQSQQSHHWVKWVGGIAIALIVVLLIMWLPV